MIIIITIINKRHETFDYDEIVKSLPPFCEVTLDSSALQPNVATLLYNVCLVSQLSRPYRLLMWLQICHTSANRTGSKIVSQNYVPTRNTT